MVDGDQVTGPRSPGALKVLTAMPGLVVAAANQFEQSLAPAPVTMPFAM